jgi:hypothetical protein
MNAIDPIRSIGRSSSAVLATIVRQLHKLPYYGCGNFLIMPLQLQSQMNNTTTTMTMLSELLP